jgi:hypothetical protein
MVVVRQRPLSGAPYDIKDGQVGSTHQNVSEGTRLFTEYGDDLARCANRTANDLANSVTAPLGKGGTTIGGETIDIEHQYSPDFDGTPSI